MLKYSSAVKSVFTHLEDAVVSTSLLQNWDLHPPVAGTLLMPIWVFPQKPSWNGGPAISKVTGPGGWLHPMPDQCLTLDLNSAQLRGNTAVSQLHETKTFIAGAFFLFASISLAFYFKKVFPPGKS